MFAERIFVLAALILAWAPANRAAATTSLATTNLCAGLVRDKLPHPMTALPKPAPGEPLIDPEFRTRIVRITDVAAQLRSTAGAAKPAYSTIPAWNADESYLIVYVTQKSGAAGHFLLDGHTYRPIRALDIEPTDIEHFYWSSTDPDVLYYPLAWESSGISQRQLIRYHVRSNRKEVLYEFPQAAAPAAYRVDFGGDPMYSSWDNDLFGFRRRGERDAAFTFRLSRRQESERVASDDAPQICASGKCYVLRNEVRNSATHALIRTLQGDASEHGAMLMLANGQDVRATVQFDVAPVGTLIAENLTTGVVTEIVGERTGYPYPPTHTHISAHAFKAPGWVAVSVTGDPQGRKVLDSELLLANLNDGTVCRVAHHRTSGDDGPNGYWAEPHVNISPTGTRLLFGSDWGSGSAVDTYVVELPGYRR